MFTIVKFKTLTSTNDTAKEYPINSVIIAEKQTNGRGRFNREWSSADGGIYLSFVIKPKDWNLCIATFMSALAIYNAIKKTCNLDTEIKWPNDLLFQGRKLVGILTENMHQAENRKMIIGIGINVNNSIPKSLNAISLKDILKKSLDKEKLITILIPEFERLYQRYYSKKRFGYLITEWRKKCKTLGRIVRVNCIEGEFIGKAIDIDSNCRLIIQLKDGKKKKIIEGDVEYLE
ncbi:MAG: biotin--[acetyl-CoA-carboxylase] ligase [Nanoarchaeota archaeon]